MTVKQIAKVLVFRELDGNVLSLRRTLSDENRPGQWDLPGGSVDPGEEPTAASVHESKEEAGLDLKSVDLVYAQTAIDNKKILVRLCYVAFTDQTEVRLSAEHSEYQWMSLDELIKTFSHPVYSVFMKLVRDQQLTLLKK